MARTAWSEINDEQSTMTGGMAAMAAEGIEAEVAAAIAGRATVELVETS
jgi:hypothetical protein